MNIQGWFPLEMTGLIALLSKGLLSLLQHCNSKASVLQCSVFFMIQLSHPHLTTGKTIALTIWTLVGKMMSLLFNTLSQFITAFLPRRKHLLISWLELSAVTLEPEKIKSVTDSGYGNCIVNCLAFLRAWSVILWLRVQEDRVAKSCLETTIRAIKLGPPLVQGSLGKVFALSVFPTRALCP